VTLLNPIRLKIAYRRLTLAFSLFSVHLVEDPNDLFAKISQKLSQRGLGTPAFKLPTPSKSAEELWGLGELSKSVEEFAKSGFRGRMRARKIRRQLVELAIPVKQSAKLEQTSGQVRVLFYFTNSKPFTESGYTERSHQLLMALKNHGVSVMGVTRLGYPAVIGTFPARGHSVVDGIKYVHLLPKKFPMEKSAQIDLAVRMLVKEARDFDATVLHTTTDFKNAIVVSRAAEILEIPWVYETRGELHKTWLSKKPKNFQTDAISSEFYLAASRKEFESMRKAAAVVQLSEISKASAVGEGISGDKIAIVPNAVSAIEIGRNYDRTLVREELGLQKGKKLVGAITSVVQYEGLDDLLKAVKLLPEIDCIIVGDGESTSSLEQLVRELGIEDQVEFIGKQPSESIWKWYAALDLFVIPRKNQEVCRTVTPIKTLLAQANGIPVVASDLPALREVTGNRAVYVSPENPGMLAQTIEWIFSQGMKNMDDLRRASRKWVENRTWEANALRLVALYRQSGKT